MHVNMALCKDGKNVFEDPEDELGLSREAYAFIAGIFAHIKGMTALFNPLVNSYKRLVSGYEAPVYIAWSASNRSPLVRVPASRGVGTRLELRNPDPSANPYLTLALCLAAGLDGIRRGLTPPDSTDANIFELTEDEREERGILSLPSNLSEAVRAMKRDPLIRETLGEHIFQKYVTHKKEEWDDYKIRVTQWELERYLERY